MTSKKQKVIFEAYKKIGLKQTALAKATGKVKCSIHQYSKGIYTAPDYVLDTAVSLILKALERRIEKKTKEVDYAYLMQRTIIKQINNAMKEDAKDNLVAIKTIKTIITKTI